MDKNELNDYYYDLLNIKKNKQNRISDIIRIINEHKGELATVENYDGLCKVFSNNIAISLKNNDLDYRILNTTDYGSDYEHIFIVAIYKTDVIKYVLIDPTFSQFVQTPDKKLIAFTKWPSDILRKTENGTNLLSSLTTNGCSFIDNNLFNLYLNAFNSLKHNFDLGEILTNKNHDSKKI